MRHTIFLVLIALGLACFAAPAFAHQVIYDFSLDTNPYWTTTGTWSWGSTSDMAVTAAHTGTNWYSFKRDSAPGAHDGYYPASMTHQETLTTTAIDCTGLHSVRLSFWRYLDLDSSGDYAAIRVSNDGEGWTTVWHSAGLVLVDQAWTQLEYDISAVADDQPTVYIQWVMGPTDTSATGFGWNIDDVQILVDPTPDLIYSFPMTYNPGWTTSGSWAWGPPGGIGDDPSDAHTGTGAGNNVYGYNLSGNYEANILPPGYALTTGVLDCSRVTHTTLKFWRWLSVESPVWDEATVQVSADNGSTWTTIWQNQGLVFDGDWQLCSYDISDIADGHSQVRVRWVMGPTDAVFEYGGWNIDDVQIWGNSDWPPIQVLAWLRYSDQTTEYPNTVNALANTGRPYAVTESFTLDPDVLAKELKGKHIFLVPEQVSGTSLLLQAAGAAFADVLQKFVWDGGTLIVCGEMGAPSGDRGGFLNSTGLMDVIQRGMSVDSSTGTLTTVATSHYVASGVSATFGGTNSTACYSVGGGATVVVRDSNSYAVVAAREYGFGGVVLIGFDYYASNADADKLIGNAGLYPRSIPNIFQWGTQSTKEVTREALARLGIRFWWTPGGTADGWEGLMDFLPWDLFAVDAPSTAGAGVGQPTDNWAAFLAKVNGGAKAIMSTVALTSLPDVQTAFDIASASASDTVPSLYDWDNEFSLFHKPEALLPLTEWTNTISTSAELLTPNADGLALAGFAETPTDGKAAVVLGNGGRTIYDGFRFDEGNQDANGNGIDDTVELVMNEATMLLRQPIMGFGVSWSGGGTGPVSVHAFDMTGNYPTAWLWDFTDGATSTEQNPDHTYYDVGTYSISLRSSNGYNYCYGKIPDFLTITQAPARADFTATPLSGSIPLNVTFTDTSKNTPTAWAWTFGDTGTASTQNPSHSYGSVGVYTVTLTASNTLGTNTKTRTNYITALPQPPATDFTGTPTAGLVPLTVTFTDTSSGAPTAWAWTFGDSGPGSTSSVHNPSHIYDAPGTYTVALTATNAGGSNTKTRTNYITAALTPSVDFVGAPTSGAAPLGVAFTDTSTNSPTAWSWNFGDGTATSSLQNPPHIYTAPGTYTVALTATNAGGSTTKTRTGYISVSVPVRASFTAEPTAGIKPLNVAFTDTSTGSPTAWSWNFGDGSAASSVQSPSHSYADAGYYTVALTASNAASSDTSTRTGLLAVGFTDTPPDNWAFYQILACVTAKVVTGYPDGTYLPGNQVTRDQMAVYVSRALAGGDALVPSGPATATFPDVPVGHWAFRYVEYAKGQNIVTGYPDGGYHPTVPVTRDQMAVYISRSVATPHGDAGLAGYTPPATASFADVPTTFWAFKYIEYAKAQGIVQGYADGYHPATVVTRDQMAVYMQRAFDLPQYPQ